GRPHPRRACQNGHLVEGHEEQGNWRNRNDVGSHALEFFSTSWPGLTRPSRAERALSPYALDRRLAKGRETTASIGGLARKGSRRYVLTDSSHNNAAIWPKARDLRRYS